MYKINVDRRMILPKCKMWWSISDRELHEDPDSKKNLVVFHQSMTFEYILRKTSIFFDTLWDSKRDPFWPERSLDYHDQYHLHSLCFFTMDCFETVMVKELKNEPKVQNITLVSELNHIDDSSNKTLQEFEQDVLESLFDVWFSLFRKYTGFKSFLEISENHVLTESIKYITPNFIQHFNIQGVVDEFAFVMKVRYAGLQLGLSLRKAPILCPPMREKYNYDTYDPYVRFNCDVGSHAYFDRNKRDNSKIERDFDIHEDLVSICPFYITYKRVHLDDENSAF